VHAVETGLGEARATSSMPTWVTMDTIGTVSQWPYGYTRAQAKGDPTWGVFVAMVGTVAL
jgi:hypothetical protein